MKPIFLLTHPRSRSTAFLRMMMTQPDEINCLHEPFAECFYFGPERMAERYTNGMNEERRVASGYSQSTYYTVMETIRNEYNKGTRLFIKDMAKFFVPPGQRPVSIAPSVLGNDQTTTNNPDTMQTITTKARVPSERIIQMPASTFGALSSPGIAEFQNPTVLPSSLLKQFHFVFLIRPPQDSVPSYYRLTLEPYSALNGMYYFLPNDVSYGELRAMFDFLCLIDAVGSRDPGQDHIVPASEHNVCVIDSDDLVDQPAETMKKFCEHVGIEYSPGMLNFTKIEGDGHAAANLKHWGDAFHEEAMASSRLIPRDTAHKPRTDKEYFTNWVETFGLEAANVIKQTVEENKPHYSYLKQFAIRLNQ